MALTTTHVENHGRFDYDAKQIRVKVYLLSGGIVGFRDIGETQEEILTFPGHFTVSDALGEGNTWSRRAKEDEIPEHTRRLKDRTEVSFMQVPRIQELYHSNLKPAFGHQIMASDGDRPGKRGTMGESRLARA